MHLLRSASLSLTVALGLVACDTAKTSRSVGSSQSVAVEVTPTAVTLAPGARQAFTASVTGTVNVQVTWVVAEGAAGGSVAASGAYTAPAAPGTYHVVATSAADPSATATATVTVTTAPVVTVAVSPRTATVGAGASTTFTATVTGSANAAVTWSVAEAGCGSITAAGRYTAPAAAATCHVVATSAADPARSDTATVTVTAPQPVTLTLAPLTGTVDACRTLAFTATVSGTTNRAVTWSVAEGAAGGAVSAGGVYTAPDTAGTYHVVAASQADPTKTQTATVTVVERILGVAVSPSSLSIPPGGTAQFTATVTTTCGSFAQMKTLAADGTVN